MSISLSLLVAAGPCLLTAMAALALLVVHGGLSPVRHALIWSAACAMATLQWGLMAARGLAGGPELPGGALVDFLALASIVLLAEGFVVRAGARAAGRAVRLVALAAAALLALSFLGPPRPIRAAIVPGASVILLVLAAFTVARVRDRAAASEVAAIATLLALAIIHMAGTALAIGEEIGLVWSHAAYLELYLATVDPICAAIALVILLLIAFDFSTELQRLVHTDPLTGALNRLGFEHVARQALDRARGRPLSIAIADIDFFKQVNDRHGHVAGDAALVRFARHLSQALRRDEAMGRIGGEEFALLLPGSDAADALRRIEPIRATTAALRVDGHEALGITASFGIAAHRAGETLAALVERADHALYRSKREGRDRSTLAVDGVADAR